MTINKHRGHDVEEIWIYSDNGMPVSQDKNRYCGYCLKPNTPEGHDGCIGTLSGVKNACCGHGNPDLAYITFENGKFLDGSIADKYIKNMKLNSV